MDSLGIPGNVLYAGAASKIINGVFQVNVRMPAGAQPPFTLQSVTGTKSINSSPLVTTVLWSNGIAIYTK